MHILWPHYDGIYIVIISGEKKLSCLPTVCAYVYAKKKLLKFREIRLEPLKKTLNHLTCNHCGLF